MSTIGRDYIFQTLFVFTLLLIQSNLLLGQETVSFRTDRDIYVAGESVWISVKCIKNGTATGSTLSNVAYLEVLNSGNVPVKQIKMHLNSNGSATTRLVLPDTLSTDNYRLRGYTKWMRNYNADLYFNKTISVVNPFVNKTFPRGEKAFNNDTVVFYPEGGRIISGVKNHVTFQSLNPYSRGKSVHGYIVSLSGDTVATVTSNENGIGKFSFELTNGNEYKFYMNNDGVELVLPLPQIHTLGYAIHLLDDTASKMTFKIVVSQQEVNEQKRGFLHIAMRGGEFLKSYPIRINQGECIVVEKDNLPNSILYASIIDDSGKVLSSRCFRSVGLSALSGIELKTDKLTYNTREKVSVDIVNTNMLSDVSVSVVKSCLLNDSPGVIGNKEFPDQTINRWQKGDITINDMLVCFNPVTDILAKTEKVEFLPEIEGEIISGVIVDKDSNQPIANKDFIFSFVGKVPNVLIAATDSLGRFYFVTNRFGEREMVIQPFSKDTSDLNYSINLDNTYSNNYSTFPIAALYMDASKVEAINKVIINMQVNTVYQPFNSYPIKPTEPITPLPFYGKPEETIAIGHFIDLPTMEDVIREIVPYVYLRRSKKEYYFYIYDAKLKYQQEDRAFSIVDGVPVWDTDRILKINPEEMDSIEVIKSNYYLHRYNLGGIVNFYTKKGDLSAMEFDKRIFRQSQQCYSYSYNFNSPDYSVDSVNGSRIPDFRNLLFWDPEITFGDDHSAKVSFYTSDEVSEYIIMLEVLDAEGRIQRFQYPFEVKD